MSDLRCIPSASVFARLSLLRVERITGRVNDALGMELVQGLLVLAMTLELPVCQLVLLLELLVLLEEGVAVGVELVLFVLDLLHLLARALLLRGALEQMGGLAFGS